MYVCYNDPFFEANATALGVVDAPRNVLILSDADADFAQFHILATMNATEQMKVSVKHHFTGNPVSQQLGVMPGGATKKDYAFNAPIGVGPTPGAPNREGVYTCSFPAGTPAPTAYEIKIQFAEAAGLPTIIGVPLTATPNPLTVNGNDITQSEKFSLPDLIATGGPNAFYFNSSASMLYVRTTTVVLGPNGLALDGTRNVIKVNQ